MKYKLSSSSTSSYVSVFWFIHHYTGFLRMALYWDQKLKHATAFKILKPGEDRIGGETIVR